MAIYVKFGRQKTVKRFLELLFSYESPYDISLFSVETFKDKECTIRQCGNGKFRSIEDVLEIVNTYYKDITYKKLMRYLISLKLVKDNRKLYLYPISCTDINKSTFNFYKIVDIIENIPDKKRNSKYSWKELFEMVNIKTTEDIKKYRDEEI